VNINATIIHDFTKMLLSWEGLPTLALFCLLVGLAGWASLRLLRSQPDFPGKERMMQGARWGWVALLAFYMLLAGVELAWILLLPWKLTALVSARMIGLVLMFIVLALVGRRSELYLAGLMFWAAPYHKPFATGFISHRPFDAHEWLAYEEARKERLRASRRGRVWRWALPVILALDLGMMLWAVQWVGRVDRDQAEIARIDKLATTLQAEMNDPQVTKLSFSGRMTSLGDSYDLPPSAFATLQPDASQEEADRVARRIEEALRRRPEQGIWWVEVSAHKSRSRVNEWYNPSTGQATPKPEQHQRSTAK
jgi:hypothetical protein